MPVLYFTPLVDCRLQHLIADCSDLASNNTVPSKYIAHLSSFFLSRWWYVEIYSPKIVYNFLVQLMIRHIFFISPFSKNNPRFSKTTTAQHQHARRQHVRPPSRFSFSATLQPTRSNLRDSALSTHKWRACTLRLEQAGDMPFPFHVVRCSTLHPV